MLTLASSRCSALQELRLSFVELGQPQAPLAHLTSLVLFGCLFYGRAHQPLQQILATAAPRLELLSVSGRSSFGKIAKAAAGAEA